MNLKFQWQWLPPVLIYAASTLEVIIMVSPFAAYFYSVYTPLFHGLTQYEATAWLSQFFLPHLATTRTPVFQYLAYLGPALAVIGLPGFFACAVQLYYGKFVRKRLVSSGLYARVRHPQYLCLAVAGLGFLLMWPRFLILLTYLMMLGLYHMLARHEEEVIRKKYGQESEHYMAAIPMFNPFRKRFEARSWSPPSRVAALFVWIMLVITGVSLAFLLRMEAETQLYAVRWETPNTMAISFSPHTNEQITAVMQSVLSVEPFRLIVDQRPEDTFLMQIATGGAEAKHLLTDLGMKADAIQMLQLADQGEYIVVSLLTALQGRVEPFALDTRIEPLFFVRPGADGKLDARAFIPEQFYPDFSRTMF